MFPIIVCGHISGGTSVIARLLQTQFGIMTNFGPLKVDDTQPQGYYEEPVLIKLNTANFMAYSKRKDKRKLVDETWHKRFGKYVNYMQSHYRAWGFKDPRMNVILKDAMQHFKMPPTFIRCDRSIDKVKNSQKSRRKLPISDAEMNIVYKENHFYLDKFLKPFFHLTLDMTDYVPEDILIGKIKRFLRIKSTVTPAFLNNLSKNEVFDRWR